MPIIIKLTRSSEQIWINAEKIAWMMKDGDWTWVCTQEEPDSRWCVRETPEEIHMIIEEEVANMNRCARKEHK